MVEVSKEKFYDTVMNLNTTVSPTGDRWPYTSEYKSRSGNGLIGKAVGSLPDGKKYPELKRYYLKENLI